MPLKSVQSRPPVIGMRLIGKPPPDLPWPGWQLTELVASVPPLKELGSFVVKLLSVSVVPLLR